MMRYKWCRECEEIKPYTEFSVHSKEDYRKGVCSACAGEETAWREYEDSVFGKVEFLND